MELLILVGGGLISCLRDTLRIEQYVLDQDKNMYAVHYINGNVKGIDTKAEFKKIVVEGKADIVTQNEAYKLIQQELKKRQAKMNTYVLDVQRVENTSIDIKANSFEEAVAIGKALEHKALNYWELVIDNQAIDSKEFDIENILDQSAIDIDDIYYKDSIFEVLDVFEEDRRLV